jgi:hypothetical protein
MLAACGGDDAEAFDTFQDCYTEHHDVESLTVNEAIVVCCIDHPIGGHKGTVCGTTSADCVTYITGNVTGPTSTEIMSACDEYVVQKDM